MIYYVDKVQGQGKRQRRIPLPKKFWEEFPVGSIVKIELIKKGEEEKKKVYKKKWIKVR